MTMRIPVNRLRGTVAIQSLLLASLSPAGTAAQLPIVCTAGSCGPNAPASFVGAGQATATEVGNTLTINQTSEQAILNWASFNVSADGKVIFKQPNAAALALNQIFQASPSQILGLVQANGQIYLVNQNGIIFGSTARVNVGGLLASTLSLTGPLSGGLLAPIQNSLPALAAATGQSSSGEVLVEPGAQLTAAEGSRLFLAGGSVINGGTLSAPDGQVILSAGQSVFIQASTDPGLRGLVVEVDGGGLAQNQAQGSIAVAEGNATLVGLAVNQQGRISATTSVSENGSIRLLARDTVNVQSVLGTLELFPSRGGTLTLGPQSQTSVLPDIASTATAVDQQAQPQSTITLAGQTVDLSGGSTVFAPSGKVSITTSTDPSAQNASATADPAAHLRIDSGATIDVSGSEASVPVTSNLISVQLRGSELADDPVQRDGPLRGQTVIIDSRVGTPLANVAGDIALIQRNVLQRTTSGGSIVLDSGGDVVVAAGSKLDVSGGAVTYTPGVMQTSRLIESDGATVDIGNASPDQNYVGVVNPNYRSVSNEFGVISLIPTPGIAHYDPGYVQGASAGSIQVLGSSLILDGNFVGHAVNGIYQRSGSDVASGGTFTIGTSTPTNAAFPDYRAPAVELVNTTPIVVVDSTASLPSDLPVEISSSQLTAGGFTHLQISSNDKITLPSGVPIDMAAGGSIALLAPLIEIDSSIKAPAGTIEITSAPSLNAPQGTSGLGLFVGDGVKFDVSGMWTNDLLTSIDRPPTGLALIDAGSVQLNQNVFQGTLSLGNAVELLANGGAQLQRGGKLSGGQGGAVALIGSPGGTVQLGQGDALQGFGVQGALGGSFTLEVPRLQIGSGGSSWSGAQSISSDPNAISMFKIDASLFSDFGFSKFSLTADGPASNSGLTHDILTVLPQTTIDLVTRTLKLGPSAAQQASGSALTDFAAPSLLPGYLRSPSQLTLRASPGNITQTEIGDLTVGSNASINADPGSSVTLASVGNLLFNGAINAPAGHVSLEILTPAEAFDPGFVPDLRLEVGSQASINVAGTAVYQPQTTGLLVGQVLAGGDVTLNAARGVVLTDTGSLINFSGTQAPIDLPYSGANSSQRQTVASSAGSLTVASPESISLLGSFLGDAGVGTTGRAAGGSLDLTLSRLAVPVGGFPDRPLVITVQPNPLSEALSSSSGSAVLGTAQLASSGIDTLALVADNAVSFTNGAQLDLARSVTLTTPAIEVQSQAPVGISAPYIALGTANTLTAPQLALPGSGNITFNGAAVDLIGSLAFQGVGTANITSSGEILLRGELNDANNLGSLSIAGDLTLNAARIVPTSTVNYTITASGGRDNTVAFTQNGSLSGTPLSVDGSLAVNADTIIQAGTLFAPFGQLNFNAKDDLTFAPGSLTSVSGSASVLPFGEVQNGTAWVYQVSPNQLVPAAVTALPVRQVTASGAKVTLASGATIDVSGGGDLNAYQWTPGTGGTSDVLSNTVTPGLYAILPSLVGRTAPFDPMAWAGSNLAPNESIYLSGGGGLPAGVYPLLPARYALLPGAFLVSAVSGTQDFQPGTTSQSANGFPIVSGYLTNGNTGIGDTRATGFLIEPGSYATSLSNYTGAYASSFFAAPANTNVPATALPADGGTLVLSAETALNALGSVKGAAASGGEGATVEIIAPQIEVDPTIGTGASVPGLVHLPSDVLQQWNAGRLWLGVQSTPNGSFSVGADTVRVASGSNLSADEVLLAATGSVQVDAGASIVTPSSADSTIKPAATTAAATAMPLSGNGAGAVILAASDLTDWQPERSGTPAVAGTLQISSGATVASRGALILDAPGGGILADGSLVGPGAQWSFGTSTITFGPQGSATTGFVLDNSLVGAMQSAGSLRFASVDPINILQPVTLIGNGANPSINEIDFQSPGISNNAGAASSRFAASLISLTGGSSAVTPQAGSGALNLSARQIDVDSGNTALSGFATTTLDASDALVGIGNGSLSSAGDLRVLTPLVTAQSGAQTQLSSGGNLVLAPSAQSSNNAAATLQSGGSLSLQGQSVTDGTQILMPSGEVTIQAVQQLSLTAGAAIDVAGARPAGAPHGSDGGSITLTAGGALSVAAGVPLSVAGGVGANAGTVSILAGGVADIDGTLDGAAANGQRTGSFLLRAGSVVDFGSLNNALEQGGFHETRSIDVGSGDLVLAAGSTITAHLVELTADSGSIDIAGNIDASSPAGGGSIALNANNSLSVAATAQLRADGTATGVLGGLIELSSVDGVVQFDSASRVSAQGAGASGMLQVRAPTVSGSDIAIATLPSDLRNVGLVVLEPILPSSIEGQATAADFAAIESNIAGYMTAAQPNILNRLGLGSISNVAVRPYADITTPGSLSLPSVDFGLWRFAGQPADISIRAGGALTLTGTLSDGFNTSAGYLDVQSTPSANLSLVAGANFSSASDTAVNASSASDLNLNAGAIVRTGSGSIKLTSAQDIVFGLGATVYTGGISGAASTTNTSTGVPLSFATRGGSIDLVAARDVVGAPVTQAVDMWNPRFQPIANGAAVWGVDFQAFKWNIGALGGGDVVINAGRNVLDVTAAVADSRTFAPDGVTPIALGGGELSVNAGGDVDSGLFYVGKGIGRIEAGGALSSSMTDARGNPLNTLLLAGDASFYISAQRDVQLQGMVSETALVPGNNSDQIFYFRYEPNSTLALQSRGGSITYDTNLSRDTAYLGTAATFQSDAGVFQSAPPTMDFAAFGSDVNLVSTSQNLPSAVGQLSIYAARDIVSAGALIGMSDQTIATVASADAPSDFSSVSNIAALSYTGGSVHQNDPTPALISAGRDINNIQLAFPKQAEITAGRDIVSTVVNGQNLNPTDATIISAGRNIEYTPADSTKGIDVAGPGNLLIIAGGTVNLGDSAGITTYGNILNSNLAYANGASISVLAGLGAPIGVAAANNSSDFLAKVIAPSKTYQTMLVNYVEQSTDQVALSFSTAEQAFRGLSVAEQLPLIEKVFFDQLVVSGQQANQSPSLGFGLGYAAIDSLFPGSRTQNSPYAGDLTMGYSRIYTLNGGSISLLVPGGEIDVGLASPPANFSIAGLSKPPSDLGIVAVGSGDVDIYSLGSVAVDQSRVFTLGGGDIAIWSTLGNIDAGNGAKTSISAPPPSIQVDANGNVTLNFAGAVAGSGIRTIQSEPGVPAGDVNLIAPVGFVNAGDAGIGSAGNINIAAQHVIGATNINFGGTATGVPPEVSGIGASLSGAASVSNSAATVASSSVENTAQAAGAAPLAAAALGWLDVFIEGFGEEVCKPADLDCLKRNHK